MLALIPARGGSKCLPGKNIKELCGKPLIAYTIESASNAKNIDSVIVSTDDTEIEKIAIKYGATSPFKRPRSLATDTSLAIDTYLYTIERLNSEFNYSIKEFCVLLPTSPLRKSEDIDSAIELFKNNNADSVISFTKAQHPLNWHKYVNHDNKISSVFNEEIKNRQDEKDTFYPNGAIYVFNYEFLRKKREYYSSNSYTYIMPRNRSIDIDTIDDFEFAEFLLRGKHEGIRKI